MASASTRTLVAGDRLLFALATSEPVVVTGQPQLAFALDSSASKTARYDANLSSASSLVFAYTVLAGDRDAAGGITVAANAVSLSAGAILDLNGNPATLSTTAV
eukprot:gene37985-61396_t